MARELGEYGVLGELWVLGRVWKLWDLEVVTYPGRPKRLDVRATG